MSQPKTETMSVAMIVQQLNKIRQEKGEEAYELARRGLALDLVLKPNGEAFLKNAFPDMDLKELKAEAEKTQSAPQASPEEAMRQMLTAQMPNLKTQGHYDLFMAAFDALRKTLNAYFGDNKAGGDHTREQLNKALDMAIKIPEMVQQLAEMDDDKSDKAQAFTRPATELHEYDIQKQLLLELTAIETSEALEEWYASKREPLDNIVSKRARDEVFDAIRAKRKALKAN